MERGEAASQPIHFTINPLQSIQSIQKFKFLIDDWWNGIDEVKLNWIVGAAQLASSPFVEFINQNQSINQIKIILIGDWWLIDSFNFTLIIKEIKWFYFFNSISFLLFSSCSINQQSTLPSLQSKKLIEWREESWVDFIYWWICWLWAGGSSSAPPFHSKKINFLFVSAGLLYWFINEEKRRDWFVFVEERE